MADVSADSRAGEVLDGRYRIIEPLASGGMGVVYRAERLGLGRFVAVKFLSTEGASSEQAIKRFEREARAMSRLNHPHVVSVIDFGVADTPYIVMEYVTGRALHDLIALGPADASRAIDIMRQLLAGLAHAHGHGIIHRDIKPANVMLTEATGTGDYVRILDFGLAKLKGAASLSSTNVVVGTPSYMAPEQSRGQDEDGRSDIYSAGVLFYELLKGDKPFYASKPLEILRMHQNDPVPPLGELRGVSSDVAMAIQGVVHRAMAKKPRDRFQSALKMGDALGELVDLAGARGKERRRRKGTTDVGRAKTIPIESADLAVFEEPEPIEIAPEPGVAPLPDLALSSEPEVADDAPEPLAEGEPVMPHLEPEPRRSSRAGGLFVLLVLIAGAAGAYLWWERRQAETPPVRSTRPVERVAAVPPAVDAAATEIAAPIDAAPAVADAGTDAAPAIADAGVALDAGVAGEDLVDGGAALLDPDEVPESESIEEIIDAGPIDAAAPLPPRPASIERWADVKVLLARGEIDAAVIGLRKLVRKYPKNAFYKLRLGHLYFARNAWTEALKLYRVALRLQPRYRRYKSVNTNAIRALGSSNTRWRAHRLITRSIGRRIAMPHLRREARFNKSALVRKRAAALVKRFR